MSEELSRKKSVRAAQRSIITKTIGTVKDLTTQPEIDKARLRHKKLALEEKREIVRRLDGEILETVKEEEIEAEIERADEVQEQIELALILVEETLKTPSSAGRAPSLPSVVTPAARRGSSEETGEDTHTHSPREGSPVVPATPTPATAAPSEGASAASPPIQPSRVKLPELTLRKFNGDLTKWGTFWDTFESTIHKSPLLSPVEKFSYLQSLLESSAAEAVSGLAVTAANYEEAIKILKRRYGNKQLIISRHMDVLMNLEGVSSYNDTRQLRHLFDTVETQVRGLKALGVSAESYGGLLSSVLLSKLPPEIRLIVSRGLSGDHWELDEILNLLEAELTAREMATAAQLKKPAFSRGPSVLRRVPPTASTLVASMSTSCVYCGQSHDSSSCSAVPIVEARKQSLRRSGRCYVCLRRNHISRSCRSSMKCSRCGGKHHNSICLQSAGGGREATARFPSEGENRPGSTTTPVMYVNSRTQVMLQTATVVVHRAGKCRPTCSARAVLDCGSQRTYVTSRVQQALSLPTASTEMVEIKTFGSTESLKQPCNLVTLGIITRNGRSLRINALVVPHICDAIHGQPPKVVMRQYPHLMDLDLADGGERVGMTIDLLIGADHYWSMVSGKVRRGETGPIALDTRVGWVLSGPIENNATEQSIVGFINTHALQVHTLPESTDVNEGLRRFWELESIGINPVEESVHSKFTQAIAFKNGRYEVSLPWRAGCKDLPENYDLCVKRLYGLQRRLQQDPSLCQAYDEVIREQLRNGIIEQVPESSEPPEKSTLPTPSSCAEEGQSHIEGEDCL